MWCGVRLFWFSWIVCRFCILFFWWLMVVCCWRKNWVSVMIVFGLLRNCMIWFGVRLDVCLVIMVCIVRWCVRVLVMCWCWKMMFVLMIRYLVCCCGWCRCIWLRYYRWWCLIMWKSICVIVWFSLMICISWLVFMVVIRMCMVIFLCWGWCVSCWRICFWFGWWLIVGSVLRKRNLFVLRFCCCIVLVL